MSPSEKDLPVVQLVKIIGVAELDVRYDIAFHRLFAGNDVRAGLQIFLIAAVAGGAVARFEIEHVRMAELRYVLRQYRPAFFVILVADQQPHSPVHKALLLPECILERLVDEYVFQNVLGQIAESRPSASLVLTGRNVELDKYRFSVTVNAEIPADNV